MPINITTGTKTSFPTVSLGELQRLRTTLQKEVLNWIHDYVRRRIDDLSLGEGRSPLEGYSTNPLKVPYKGIPKRRVRPTGGTKIRGGQFFMGGYREYKDKAGLVSDRFNFRNTGDAWRDWKVLLYGDLSSPGEIGFSNVDNAVAANMSQEKRPLLFSLDITELSVLDTEVITMINDKFFPA